MMLCCPENASGAAGGGPVAGPSSSGGPPSLAGDGSFSFCNNSQSTDDLGVESMCDDLDFDFNFEEAAAASSSSLCQQQPGFSYRYVLFCLFKISLPNFFLCFRASPTINAFLVFVLPATAKSPPPLTPQIPAA